MKALAFELDFHKFAKYDAFDRNGFMRIINQILIRHEGPVWKFSLYIPNMYIDSFQEVDKWMILVSRKGVREFTFLGNNTCTPYRLPCYMFSCQELTNLKLENCFFKPPHEFEGFPNLETLAIAKTEFGCGSGTQINLPKLKTLYVIICTKVYNFNIKATKLEVLLINDSPDAMFLRLLDKGPCLTQVGIHFRQPIKESIRIKKMTFAMMLSNLPKAEVLHTGGRFFKVLIVEKIPKWLPHPLNSLKYICLLRFQFGDLYQLEGALCLLRNAPNLENFSVTSLEMKSQPDDVGPASDHLEAPNCLDCTLNRLQKVDIKSFQGSTPELLFIKLLLAHSPSIQKFTIEAPDAHIRLDILKDIVIKFPRASPKANMVFSNSRTW